MKVLRTVAKNSGKQADATIRSANEAKERNGHLAELQLEGHQISSNNAKAILEAVAQIKIQHVNIQNVDKQTVKGDK